MKVSELIEHLETVEDEYGDLEVGATCDGWVPGEVAVEVQEESNSCILYGCRSVASYGHLGYDTDGVTVINEDE